MGDRVPWSSFDPYRIVDQVPQLRRGQVWCIPCGHTFTIDSAKALRDGWPTHCGQTMTIDSPEERAALAATRK